MERHGDPRSQTRLGRGAGRRGGPVIARVALMRPIADARRSGQLLQQRGFEPVFAPVIEIRPTGARPPDEEFDAILATSANAVAFLSHVDIALLAKRPFYAAGERTAAAAAGAGLRQAEHAAADAAALAQWLVERLPRSSRLLYLAARDRKSELEPALRSAGHSLVTVETYIAEARPEWSDAETASVAACGAALHYSRRSAELAIVLAGRVGLEGHLRSILQACISKDAAEPLRSIGAKRIVVASGAQESLLVDALGIAADNFAADAFRSPS
jgi:uroporphyrinogen-III synthase